MGDNVAGDMPFLRVSGVPGRAVDTMFMLTLLAVGVVDLQRGVLQLVLVVEYRLDVGAYGMTVNVAGDQDVR